MPLTGLQQAALNQAPVAGGGLSAASIRNQLLAQAAQASGGGGALRGAFPVSTIDPSIIAGAADDAALLTAGLNGGGHSVPKFRTPKLGPAMPTVASAAGQVDDVIAGAGDDIVKQVATGGSKTGLMSKLMPGLGVMSKGRIAGGVGLGIAGTLGSSMVDSADIGGENSGWDRFLPGAITGGAGAGGLALALGASGPVGWAAAGAGAAGFGLYSLLTGEKDTKEERINGAYNGMKETIGTLAAQYGLSGDTLANVMLEFDAAAQINLQQGDEDGMKALIGQLETTLPSTLLQYRIQQETERKNSERIMGLQKEFAPIFQSIFDRAGINSGVAYQQALHAGDALQATNPELAALVRSNAASSRSNSDALMAAYAAQIATVPTPQSMQEQAILQQTMG